MSYNISLAILAVLLGYFFLQINNKVFKVIIGFFWLLFLPNTIYIFTDLLHIIDQWVEVAGFEKIILFVQYAVLEIIGAVTFILASRPFEVFLQRIRFGKNEKVFLIILFNFLIAFGILLGRVERINSWDVLFAIHKVWEATVNIFTAFELIGLMLLIGLFCNFFYFLFRDPIFRLFQKFMGSLTKER